MDIRKSMKLIDETYGKRLLEDRNSIKFNHSGAIDFDEQINIELSITNKEGFIEIHPLELV
jgi:hypothetical protein